LFAYHRMPQQLNVRRSVDADRIIFAIAANVSIASLNLSLMVNSVGFYQIAKLLIIPFTAVVQSVWLKESLTWQQSACTGVVLVGVAIVYVRDLSLLCLAASRHTTT